MCIRDSKYGVSDETRLKIRIEAVNLGYEFRKSASSRGRSDISDVMVIMAKKSLSDTGYYTKILESIEEALNRKSIRISLRFLDSDPEDKDIPIEWSIRSFKTSGIIIVGNISRENISLLMSTGLPVVLVDVTDPAIPADRVMTNNFLGMYFGAKYLVDTGHKRILFVGAYNNSVSFMDRYHGCKYFADNQKAVGVSFRYAIGDYDSRRQPFNRKELEAMLSRSDLPDAILCANDPIAFKIYDMLKERGLRIPEDISVVGFDDVQMCDWVEPKLTSVRSPKQELGKRAVDMLIRRIRNPDCSFECVQIGTGIAYRDSVCDRSPAKSAAAQPEKKPRRA